jgi:hypothetical protein
MGSSIRWLGGATTAGLRFQKGRNVAEFVSDCGSVDAPEWASDIQLPFPLQDLHAAAPDCGVNVLVDPRPRDCRHLRQIDNPRNAAHINAAMPAPPVCSRTTSRK